MVRSTLYFMGPCDVGVVTLKLNKRMCFDHNKFIAQHFKHLPKNMPDGRTVQISSMGGCTHRRAYSLWLFSSPSKLHINSHHGQNNLG